MPIAIDQAGLALIEGFEGFRDHLYDDATGLPIDSPAQAKGTPTIGYGTTLGAGVIDPLPLTCTQEQAALWLREYIDRAVVPAIAATGARLDQNQVNALCSIGYNEGAGIFEAGELMGNALRSGDMARVSATFLDYELPAVLAARREKERAVFDTPEPAAKPSGIVHFEGSYDIDTDRYTVVKTAGSAKYAGPPTVKEATLKIQVGASSDGPRVNIFRVS